jgi:hypothetical protein
VIGEYAGLLTLDVAFVATGVAVLFGIGLIVDRRSAILRSGLAFTVGWASYGIGATLLLTAGGALGVAISLVICAVVSAAALLLGPRIPRAAPRAIPPRRSRLDWLGAPFAVLLGVYLAVLCWRSVPGEADTNWDSWAFWLPKARSIYYFHGLDSAPGGFTHFANRDYPPLAPALEATNFHFMGSTAAAPLQFQHWLALVAFFGALAALLAKHVQAWILWPSLAVLVLMPRFGFYAGSSLPDETLGILVALAAVCGALWLLERSPVHAFLVVLLSTAAALLKNEGLLFGLAIAAVVAAVAWREGRRLLPLALISVPLLALAPWKIWLTAHGLPTSSQYYGVGDLGPAHLLAAHDRLGTAIVRLSSYLVSPERWLLVVPLSAIAAAVAVWRRPVLGVFFSSFVLLSMAGLVGIYWIGTIPIGWWLDTSGERTVISIVMTCGALFPLLVAESLRRGP